MPQISRFQAQAIGSRIYIHTHRSLQDILVLDVSDSDAPILSLQPVSSDPEPPMSRSATLRKLYIFHLHSWTSMEGPPHTIIGRGLRQCQGLCIDGGTV